LYLHLLVDSDVHLPVFRSLDLHRPDNYRNIGITVKSPAVKTRYRLIATVDFRVARYKGGYASNNAECGRLSCDAIRTRCC
jgi:hypothetical protein